MPRAKKEPLNLYRVEDGSTTKLGGMRFREAAAYAIDLSLRMQEVVTITEFSPGGKILGHVYVEAKNDHSS